MVLECHREVLYLRIGSGSEDGVRPAGWLGGGTQGLACLLRHNAAAAYLRCCNARRE